MIAGRLHAYDDRDHRTFKKDEHSSSKSTYVYQDPVQKEISDGYFKMFIEGFNKGYAKGLEDGRKEKLR